MTNLERIKNMSVNEFVRFIYELDNYEGCRIPTSCLDRNCKICIRKWLESEVNEDAEIY